MESLAYLYLACVHTDRHSERSHLTLAAGNRPFGSLPLHWHRLSSRALLGFLAIAAWMSVIGTVSPAFAYNSLGPGDRGVSVERLQTLLQVRADGVFGPQTQQALQTFQRRSNLAAKGVLDITTYDRLIAANPGAGDPQDGFAGLPLLRQGDRGPAVAALQERLREAGYFAAPLKITGHFDTATTTALKRYQADQKLQVSGFVDRSTKARLDTQTREYRPEATGGRVIGGGGYPQGYAPLTPTVRFGETSNRVATLQGKLRTLGFQQSRTNTGYYGNVTASAVKAFQRSRSLTADGVVGPTTVAALDGVTISGRRGSPYMRRVTAQRPPVAGGSGGSRPVIPGSCCCTATLRCGVSGRSVVNLQSALRQRGYYQNPNITGYYGPQTAEAVRAFQRDRGFAHSGEADPQTLAALGLPEDPLPPATV